RNSTTKLGVCRQDPTGVPPEVLCRERFQVHAAEDCLVFIPSTWPSNRLQRGGVSLTFLTVQDRPC
ncbi:hypothetical protein LDENG_00009380, partial [Lucifuga dentata]